MAPKKNTAPKTVRGQVVAQDKTPTKTTTKTGGDTKGKIDALTGLTESLGGLADLVKLLGESEGGAGGTLAGNRSDASYVAEGRSGTSNTGKKYIEGRLVSDTEFNDWLYGKSNKKGIGGAGGAGDTGGAGTSLVDAEAEKRRQQGISAYTLLLEQFNQYGLGGLVEPLKGFITEGLSPAEFTLRLRDTDAYKKRFAANAQRIAKGLSALSEAEYIGLEDQYQNVMRNYGLPASYYTRGDMGRQEGFEKFIAGDVSASELEDRIQTAQNRIIYANPEVGIALKTFYPDITNGDILAYALDPEKGLAQIKRRITAAEIGSTAVQLGLATNVTDAEYLARYGVTKEQAQSGYRTAAELLPRASFLGDIYSAQGMGPYTQATAEREIFNVPGAAEAAQQRKKLTSLEQAAFSGSSGAASGALARERAGSF